MDFQFILKMSLIGEFIPARGKYYDLIKKDWKSGLITFIDEVLSIFTEDKISLSLLESSERKTTIEIDKEFINLTLPKSYKLDSLTPLFNHPMIEIKLWSSVFPCKNLNIEQVRLSKTGIISNTILDCKIETFSMDLYRLERFENNPLPYLKTFDLSQVEKFKIIDYSPNSANIVKFLFYNNACIENSERFLYQKIIQIILYLYEKEEKLLDSTLFQDIDAFTNSVNFRYVN